MLPDEFRFFPVPKSLHPFSSDRGMILLCAGDIVQQRGTEQRIPIQRDRQRVSNFHRFLCHCSAVCFNPFSGCCSRKERVCQLRGHVGMRSFFPCFHLKYSVPLQHSIGSIRQAKLQALCKRNRHHGSQNRLDHRRMRNYCEIPGRGSNTPLKSG